MYITNTIHVFGNISSILLTIGRYTEVVISDLAKDLLNKIINYANDYTRPYRINYLLNISIHSDRMLAVGWCEDLLLYQLFLGTVFLKSSG